MKNFIMFFYNMNISNIKKRLNGDYIFEYNKNNYILKDITNINCDLSVIYNMYLYLSSNNIICNDLILNKDNNLGTLYKDRLYALTKPKINYKDKIKLIDIINYDKKTDIIDSVNWRDLWIKKIDNYNYEIEHINKKKLLLSESFPYFEGLTENAIELLYDSKKVPIYISHKRINFKSTFYDLYDPFNIIFDSKVRDITDYFKDEFINNRKIEIIKYFNENNLTLEEYKLFYIRMLYPSYYFDICDQSFLNNSEEKIKRIIDMIPKFEILIYELGDYINRNNYIIDIPEWINQH